MLTFGAAVGYIPIFLLGYFLVIRFYPLSGSARLPFIWFVGVPNLVGVQILLGVLSNLSLGVYVVVAETMALLILSLARGGRPRFSKISMALSAADKVLLIVIAFGVAIRSVCRCEDFLKPATGTHIISGSVTFRAPERCVTAMGYWSKVSSL